jgi:hypothetical protein
LGSSSQKRTPARFEIPPRDSNHVRRKDNAAARIPRTSRRSAIVLASAACATPAATATPAPGSCSATAAKWKRGAGVGGGGAIPARTSWDDSWFSKLTAKHKAVFDSPEINDGLVIANATGYIRGMRDAIGAGENDVQTVVVIRHAAVAMLFNDAMWEKYPIGRLRNVKAPRSGGVGDEESIRRDGVGSAGCWSH